MKMQVMKDLVAGLPRFPSECFDYLFCFGSMFIFLFALLTYCICPCRVRTQ